MIERKRLVVSLAVTLLLIVYPAFAQTDKKPLFLLTDYLLVGAKFKRLFNSHTSYEFGNPFPPYQAPLSRLEFPLDSWWGGMELRAAYPRFSIGVEALTNISSEADGKMQDSDWDDEENTDTKTIYSQSHCRIEPSYMIRTDADLKISDWLGLPSWLDLRPLMGFRWQNFNLVTHDGIQYELGGEPYLLPGDGIRFEQTYWQYFAGLRANVDLTKQVKLPRLNLLAQIDWAYVQGHNEDLHLLRPGQRYTFEDTTGQAWHASFGARVGLWKNLNLDLEAEYLNLNSTGTHRLFNKPMELDLSFSHGVEVWSQQITLSLMLDYMF